MNTDALWSWVNERHAVYLRKLLLENKVIWEGGGSYDQAVELARWEDRPWTLDRLTDDPILQQYKFCNVFRELDRVTAWIRYNIRRRYAGHPNLWLMLAIARTINWPPTLQFLIDTGYAWPDREGWSPADLTRALDYYSSQGNKVYTGAYMIRAESNPKAEWYSWTKQRYVAEIVIGRLWEDREAWRRILLDGGDFPGEPMTLERVWTMFQQPRYIGWGPFMAYQAVVDMRWTDLLKDAPDINTWAALGPGSRRGLNRLSGRPVDYPLSQKQGLEEMLSIYAEQDNRRAPWVPRIDLSDIQNSLCETDKYLRVKLGEGKPRSRYVPTGKGEW